MEPNLGVTFSNAQLASILLAALSMAWWGLKRLIRSIDGRFDELRNDIREIRSEYAPRAEMDAKFSGVHRRVDDFHRLFRRQSDPGHEE